MGSASNYLERGKWIRCLKLQQLAIFLLIVINISAIFSGLQTVNAFRRSSNSSKLNRRDWDLGDAHITSSHPYSTATNSSNGTEISNNLVKQRKLHPYSMPSYSIVNSTKIEPETTFDLLFGKGQSSSNSSSSNNETTSDVDFFKNLEVLKKVVRARQELVKRQQNSDIDDKGLEVRRSNSSSSKLEDNINTINVLIGMLMLANSKLIEQRDKMSPSSSLKKIRDINSNLRGYKGAGNFSMNKLEESLASSPITSRAEPKSVSKNSSISQDQVLNSTNLPTKIRKFKAYKKDINSKEPTQSDNNITPKSRQVDSADHFSVKPGFDFDNELTNLRNNVSEKNVPSEAQYSGLLFARPELIGNRKDFFRDHKPIVAHDLLNVRPHRPDPAQNVQNRHVRPENMFVSQIPIGRQPLSSIYEHLNLNKQPLNHEVDQGGLVHPIRRLPFEEINISPRDEEQYQQQHPQRMVPPYNVHNIEWPPSTTMNPLLIQNQHNEYPISQRLGEGHRYNPSPKPTFDPVLQNNLHLNSIGGNEQFVNPLHQVLMAARNQQNAVLEQERRRLLEHEMEVQKRQQEMKKQHEDNLMKQKLAHDERQKSAQNNENEQQQQNPEGQQAGLENHGNQGSQREQQDQQEQDGGNQDEGDDSNGVNQTGSGQQGGSEGDDPREEDKDMKNFQDFAGDTDFTDLFPPGILSDAEIKEMRKQHQEQKQREQEEQEERGRQKHGSSEEEQGNGEENSGRQQDTGEQTEQNNRTQTEEEGVQRQPDSSLEGKRSPILVPTNDNNTYNISSSNQKINPQVIEPKYNTTISQNISSKSGENKTSASLRHDLQTTKVPRLFVPNFLNNSSLNSSSIGQAERSTKLDQQQQQQQAATNKRRRSHHQFKVMPSSHVENNQLLPNGMIVLESEYQDKYVKPFMSITTERKNNNEYQQFEPTQPTSLSGDEDITSELAVDFEDQADKR